MNPELTSHIGENWGGVMQIKQRLQKWNDNLAKQRSRKTCMKRKKNEITFEVEGKSFLTSKQDKVCENFNISVNEEYCCATKYFLFTHYFTQHTDFNLYSKCPIYT